MESQATQINQTCPREEIAVYLDGELSSVDEISLEKHLVVCETCFAELNLHKKMISALNFAFEEKDEIELPKNFAKIVATKAESGVSGLRSKKEGFRALTLCAALFLLTIFGLGAETDKVFSSLGDLGGQFLTIIGMAFRSISDFAIGLAIVFRCLSQKVIFSPVFIIVLIGFVFALLALTFSHFRLRVVRS